tara:strand:+ start:42972 stop:43574 length:603 start_codon:yes stop_codon:yes gene_type:complete
MRLSKIISVVLHPIFMPFITLKLTLFLIPEIQFIIAPYLNFITLSVIISTIIVPLILILFFIQMGWVKSLEMDNYQERSTPLIYCSLSMFIGYQFVDSFLVFAPIIKAEFFGAIIIISIAALISRFWKISLHMLAIGGLTGALISLHFLYEGITYFVIIAIITSGVLGISRINENAHNYSQVYTGFLIGLSIELTTMLLF